MEFVAVLDFEATCDNRSSKAESSFDFAQLEIIEMPVGLVSLEEQRVVATFDSFVRPVKQPHLTAFCTELTSISQAQVDRAETIDAVMKRFETWMASNGANRQNTVVATCGDWDLKKMWPQQVAMGANTLTTPGYFKRWCNIKTVFAATAGVKAKGMLHMLEHYRLGHVGHHHRGADDVKNLCNLVLKLLDEGAVFEPTSDTTTG